MENIGTLILRPLRPNTPVMISGEGRSGTTAMARALRAGGLDIIYPDDSANAEVDPYTDAWHHKQKDALTAWYQEASRNRSGTWGVKVPGANIIATWPGMSHLWPGDWIIMTRDPLSRLAYGDTLAVLISSYLATFGAANRLDLAGRGVVLVSYEKLLTASHEVLASLGLKIDITAAAAEIIPGDPRYHVES